VVDALERARHDLGARRVHDAGDDHAAWTTAGGLPAYVSLFGRDTLTAAWQAAHVRQPSPWSLTASFGERLEDALSSLLPHR
jgi:hypothetical protein